MSAPSRPSDPVRLVLASASPARLATLASAGVHPLVQVSTVDEDAVVAGYRAEQPADVALLLARAKAEDVADQLTREADGDPDRVPGEARHGPDLGDPALDDGWVVLGCDSVLELDGETHGKPADADQARQRWRRMRGRSGILHTGHWLVDARAEGTGGTLGAVASTVVHFARVTDEEIDAYVASGEPLRVAGAFTVDGLGGPFVSGIEGDHHNVVGVSLPLLRELLAEIKVPWPWLWSGI